MSRITTVNIFFLFWSLPHTSYNSYFVWDSWVASTKLLLLRLLFTPLMLRSQSLKNLTRDKTFFLKFEMRNAYVMLTKGGDKTKIKIKQHKVNERWRWKKSELSYQVIKNNLLVHGSWKLRYVYQNKNKNSIFTEFLHYFHGKF